MKFCNVSVALLACALVGCSRGREEKRVIQGPADLVGSTCAVVVGSMMGDMTLAVQPGIEIEWFNDYNSGVEAVRLGKVAAMPLDFFYARRWARESPEAFAVTEPYHGIPWAYFFAKGSPLCGKVNAVLAKLRASGELDRILKKWSEADDPGKLPLEPLDGFADRTGRAGVLKFATPGDREPVSFVREDGFAGFDIDIARRIACELDMKLELTRITMGALVPAVQSGKADMGGGGIAITAERAEQVDFSDSYYRVPTVFLIRKSSKAGGESSGISTLADLKGKTCAVILGTAVEEMTEKYQDGIVFRSFNDYPSALEALRLGKVDAIPIDTVIARQWAAQRPDDFCIALTFSENPYGFLFPKGSPLLQRVDAIVGRLKKSGEIDRLVSKWCDAPDLGSVPPEDWRVPGFTGAGGVIRFATTADYEPGSFTRSDGIVGFDIDIVRRIAMELDMRLELMVVTMGALVPAVQTGKAEFGGGCITITEARAEKVDFTRAYMDEGLAVLVRRRAAAIEDRLSPIDSFIASFKRTFVVENRWRMMAKGLGVTLLITFTAAFFGTLLAFPVWLARTSRNAFACAVAKAFVSLLQGTPVLVLLMVLFYLVFGKVDIDGVIVAIIGFSLNASAYIGEMLRSGIDSVPRGQTEAALALGYGRKRTFFRFVLPQAVRAILPVYRGEIIGLLKSTSIVGYIAINDLTKASDLVRSRTYESFFPILTTAFIYFAASWLLAKALDKVGRRLDPAVRRARKGAVG